MSSVLAILLYFSSPEPAVPLCFVSDIKQFCCPSACAVKNSPKWKKADEVLKGCMAGIGCKDSQTKNATVFMKCDCKSK